MGTCHDSSGKYRFVNQGWGRIACLTIAISLVGVALGQVQEEWVARYNGAGNSTDVARAIAVDDAGNVYVTGQSANPETHVDFITLKYDEHGNLLWERTYDGSDGNWDQPAAIAVDSTGNVFVTGTSWGPTASYDYVTLKYDTDGNLLWMRIYNGPGNYVDIPSQIVADGAGNVYVTGFSYGDSITKYDYTTLKYDQDGNLLWVSRYNGPGRYDDRPHALAVDSAGNVYVTGESGIQTAPDYATVKYDPDGNQLWVRRYNGPHNNRDRAFALAVDAVGNVYVTGDSQGGGTIRVDYITLKYDADGNTLWERRYDGTGFRDTPTEIVVDSAGNVYVAGSSEGIGSNYDYVTLKYDAAGNLLWESRYNGLGNWSDIINSLAVDSAGNVYVTGYSFGAGTSADYATVKYDSNGNLLWRMFYDGPGNYIDTAAMLVLDRAGNLYVTGGSSGAGTGADFATIRYTQDTTITPDGFSLFRGMLTGGELSDLFASDDSWMKVLPGITLNQAERQVQLIVVGTAPTESPAELTFQLEAHASINNIGQWIELWNYDTNSYEQVDFMIATTADSIVEVTITTNPERFVQAGTKKMKAKISYKEAGIVLLFPWLISFDQTVWMIAP